MESGNAALARRVYELYQRLQETPVGPDRSAMLADVMALFADDIEYRQVGEPLDVGTVRGKRSIESFFEQWVGIWREHRISIEEVREDDDRVLVMVHEHFVPREGMEFENRGAALFTVRDGHIVRFAGYRDQAAAIAAFEAGAGD